MTFEFPSLGEPLPIELANTRYVEGDEVVDFLAPTGASEAWFAQLPTAAGIGPLGPIDDDGRALLAELRDAVRALIDAVVDGVVPAADDVAVVNTRAGTGAPIAGELTWSAEVGGFAVEPGAADGDLDAALARLALDTIALLTGPDAGRLRRCAAPDCRMLFVRHHHRRRWCHESCGHRLRQARYYRRRTGGAASS
ncbi:MAG: CGNR zinc finger domain-containing protein [Actinomycetota bacterium]